jgi:hypothetical protein
VRALNVVQVLKDRLRKQKARIATLEQQDSYRISQSLSLEAQVASLRQQLAVSDILGGICLDGAIEGKSKGMQTALRNDGVHVVCERGAGEQPSSHLTSGSPPPAGPLYAERNAGLLSYTR